MNSWRMPLAAGVSVFAFGAAVAGPVQPFDDSQPSLVINELMTPSGIFPSGGGGGFANGDTLGFVYGFAGPYAPTGTYNTLGQTIPITQNLPLFSILGATFGGNGVNNYALPNLQGQAIIGSGSGAGLTPRTLGGAVGSSSVTLTPAQVPAPGHSSAAQPYNTVQPSLTLTPLIAIAGVFPSQGGNSGTAAFLGQIAWFAGNYVPSGWAAADGQVLSIQQNAPLFSILGTTYGGNGLSTFALPNLEGRVAIGADSANPLGSEKGAETVTVTRPELPGPGQQPVDNDQPSLAVNYLIATSGIFPSLDGDPFDPNIPALGQIVAFAGNFAPSGWALADGQSLLISQNPALFAVLGTTYGGNGVTTFDLPNFDGRTAVGGGSGYTVGETFGADNIYLNADNIPMTSVPEPSVWAMTLIGFAAMGFGFRRRAIAVGHGAPRGA